MHRRTYTLGLAIYTILEKKYAISNVDQMTHIIGHSNRKKDSTNGRSLELNLIIIPSYSHFVNGTWLLKSVNVKEYYVH